MPPNPNPNLYRNLNLPSGLRILIRIKIKSMITKKNLILTPFKTAPAPLPDRLYSASFGGFGGSITKTLEF